MRASSVPNAGWFVEHCSNRPPGQPARSSGLRTLASCSATQSIFEKVPGTSPPSRVLVMLLGATLACRPEITEVEASRIAAKAIAAYAKRERFPISDFQLKEFDSSGNAVAWFFSYESKSVPKHLVSVLVDKRGHYELHQKTE